MQAAIDKLNRSGLINSDAGAATRSAMHRLLFLDPVEIRAGGPTSRPGVAQNLGQGGRNSEPLPNEKSITREPPHIEKRERARGIDGE